MLKYKRIKGIIMTVKKVILIGSGVRETYIAKRLFIDTNGEIAITVILTKRNPEISSYAKNIFLVNDFSLETFLCNSNIESFINSGYTLISINTNDNQNLSVIRQSGFQPLRIIKYWNRKECIKYRKKEYKKSFRRSRKNKYSNYLAMS